MTTPSKEIRRGWALWIPHTREYTIRKLFDTKQEAANDNWFNYIPAEVTVTIDAAKEGK
ncbi:MAG: hypothetical protein Q8O19_06475 [Rectinemataceae bacterium]|nr:hypothetical protein [Rectinemataceae bacterium]